MLDKNPTAEQNGGGARSIFQGAKGILPLRVRIFLATGLMSVGHRLTRMNRALLASKYLSGAGIEIGALHVPLKVGRSASVKYVDRLSKRELRKLYPELDSYDIV